MGIEFDLTPEFEQANKQTLENMYQSACLRFGKYLDSQPRGNNSSQGSATRRKVVDEESSIYGTYSIFIACRNEYVSGYGSIVSTLKTLRTMDVHTKTDVLHFDINHAMQHQWNFTDRKAEVVSYLKEIFALEKGIS